MNSHASVRHTVCHLQDLPGARRTRHGCFRRHFVGILSVERQRRDSAQVKPLRQGCCERVVFSAAVQHVPLQPGRRHHFVQREVHTADRRLAGDDSARHNTPIDAATACRCRTPRPLHHETQLAHPRRHGRVLACQRWAALRGQESLSRAAGGATRRRVQKDIGLVMGLTLQNPRRCPRP